MERWHWSYHDSSPLSFLESITFTYMIWRFFLILTSVFLTPFIGYAGSDFISLQWVEHTVKNGIHTLSAKGQVPVLFEKKNIPPTFDKVQIRWTNYDWPVFFIWQPLGAEFNPNKYNISLSLKDGTFFLPEKIEQKNMERVGIIFPVDSISFSDITFGQVSFPEKFSQLLKSHNPLLPSTINLIYPKYFGAIPLSKILGITVLVLALFLIFYKRHLIIIICIAAWIIWDIFYAIDQKEILKTSYLQFVSPVGNEKQFFDLGDQYGFSKSVMKYGKPDVGYYAPRAWPYYINFLYHTYPTRTIWEWTESNLVAVAYVPWTLSGTTLTVAWKTLPGEYDILEKYSDSSYLFSRK